MRPMSEPLEGRKSKRLATMVAVLFVTGVLMSCAFASGQSEVSKTSTVGWTRAQVAMEFASAILADDSARASSVVCRALPPSAFQMPGDDQRISQARITGQPIEGTDNSGFIVNEHPAPDVHVPFEGIQLGRKMLGSVGVKFGKNEDGSLCVFTFGVKLDRFLSFGGSP